MRSKPREQVAKHPRRGPEGDEEGVRKEQCGYREHRGLRGLCGGAPAGSQRKRTYKRFWVHPSPTVLAPGPGVSPS